MKSVKIMCRFTTKRVSQKRNSDFTFASEHRKKTRLSSSGAGFTLIELMVVLAIIVVITTVTMTSQSSFNKTLILANTAYDVALTMRSAQTYGLSSRARGTADVGYGLHFQTSPATSFTFFSDGYPPRGGSGLCHTPPANDPTGPDAKPGNCVYDQSQGERVADYDLGNGIRIGDFCARTLGAWSCTYAHGGYAGGLSSLDIVFTRPNPDPFISANGSYSAAFPVTAACVTLMSPQGGERYVSVASSGQIIANATSCP